MGGLGCRGCWGAARLLLAATNASQHQHLPASQPACRTACLPACLPACRWARYARVGVLDMSTNNHIERFFGTMKNTFLDRKRTLPVPAVVGLLLGTVVPFFVNQQESLEAGQAVLPTSRQKRQSAHAKRVLALLQRGPSSAAVEHLQRLQLDGAYIVHSTSHVGQVYSVNVADASCSCGSISLQCSSCHHLEAASRHEAACCTDEAAWLQDSVAAAAGEILKLAGEPAVLGLDTYGVPTLADNGRSYMTSIGTDSAPFCQCAR